MKENYAYRLRHSEQIDKVLIVRQTDKSVFLPSEKGERRRPKKTQWESYHDTLEEAKDQARQDALVRIRANERGTERLKQRIRKVDSIREEDVKVASR